MTPQRFALRSRSGWLDAAVYLAIFALFVGGAVGEADAVYLLYGIGVVAFAVLLQRFIRWRTMFVEFRENDFRVRQFKVGALAAYSLIDSISANHDNGEVTIHYRLTLPGGKLTSYHLPYSFAPRDPHVVENELRRRVQASKPSGSDV